jgi:outer membrane protein assembly factor BamB
MFRASLSALVLVGVAFSGRAADWPQFLGPSRDGVVRGQNLSHGLPTGGPGEVWSVETGIGFGGASIADGRVYLLDREEDERDVLRCIALHDGRELWRHAYESKGRVDWPGSRSTPTVDEDRVYTCGSFGHIHCVDRRTGQVVWALNMQEAYGSQVPRWGFAQSPLIYGDWVILAPMTDKVGLVALDKATGRTAWESPPIGGNTYASPRLYTIRGVEQIVFITTSGVSAIDPKTGRLLWQFTGYQNRIPIPSPTQIDEGRLFITGGYGAGSVMVRIDRDGESFSIHELWKTDHGAQIHPAMLHENHLYLNANTNETLKQRDEHGPGVICLDLEGGLQWSNDNKPSINRGGMLLIDGVAYLLSGDTGFLHLFRPNPRGYDELDRAQVFPKPGARQEPIWGPMALADGYLVLRDQKHLKCLDLKPRRQARAR